MINPAAMRQFRRDEAEIQRKMGKENISRDEARRALGFAYTDQSEIWRATFIDTAQAVALLVVFLLALTGIGSITLLMVSGVTSSLSGWRHVSGVGVSTCFILGANILVGNVLYNVKRNRPIVFGKFEIGVALLTSILVGIQMFYSAGLEGWIVQFLAQLAAMFIFIRGRETIAKGVEASFKSPDIKR